MIVHRITVHYKLGKLNEAVVLLQEEVKRARFPHAVRFYIPKFGVSDTTIGEFEFETVDELDRFWEAWEADPETKPFVEKYDQLIEPGMVHELLTLQ